MSYTPQPHRLRSSHSTVVSYSPVCPRHQVTEKLIHHDGSCSEGGSLFYSTPTHHHHSSTCTSYGTLYQQQAPPSVATTPIQLFEMSTPSSSASEDCSNTFTINSSTNKPLAWIWLVSCFLILTNNVFTLLQPFWLQDIKSGASVGLINYCVSKDLAGIDTERCQFYPSIGPLNLSSRQFPWRLTLILYLLATALLAWGSLLAAVCICITNARKRNITSLIGGYLQMFSAVFYLTSMITLPVGFDDELVRQACGTDSDIYATGSCYIGWSYALAIAGSILCSVLPIMSHYINKYEIISIDTNQNVI